MTSLRRVRRGAGAEPGDSAKEPPVVLVHAAAPPSPGGTSVIVHRLLSHPTAPESRTFADLRVRRRYRAQAAGALPGRYSWTPKLPTTSRVPAPVGGLLTLGNLGLALVAGVRAAAAARRAPVVLSVLDAGYSNVAAMVARRLSGVPHVLWVFDPWEENAYPAADRWLARALERRLFRGAAEVVVFSPELASHYRAKHAVEARVLAIPIAAPGARGESRAQRGGPAEVLVSGSVYWAQLDAVRRIAEACGSLDDVQLTVVSQTPAAAGLPGVRVEPAVPEEAFRARLARADVLAMGLSFDSPHDLVVRTATPARFPESLASGTPLLVHAPAGSYVARRAREGGGAVLVDQPDVGALAREIQRLLRDRERAAGIVARAREMAAEHDLDVVAAEFKEILGAAARRGRARARSSP